MAIPTFNPPIDPSTMRKKPKLNLKQASFGDGYTSTVRNGLNHNRTTLELSWDYLTPAQANQIDAFFTERGGDLAFTYNGVRFTCQEWSVDTGAGGRRAITATLEQSFNILEA